MSRPLFTRAGFVTAAGAAALLPLRAARAAQTPFVGCIDFDAIRRHLRVPTPRPTPLLTGAEAEAAAELRREQAALASEMRGVALRRYLWDSGTRLAISFFGGTATQRRRVTAYAPIWAQHARLALTFSDAADGDIRISFDAGALSYSAIGTEATTLPVEQPTMTLAQMTDDLSEQQARGLVLHEFGHALGLVHEHQSPVAGVPWNRPAAYRYFARAPFYLAPSEVDAQILTAYDETVTNHSQFDPHSIMVYPIPAAITDGTYEVRMNLDLSPIDKSFIAAQYA